MKIGKSDAPVQRIVVHALMIFFGLVAITPIYVLLINATRTTEQINAGFSFIPGEGAFFQSVHTLEGDWLDAEGGAGLPAEGTARYQDLVMGQTMREEMNTKTNQMELRVTKKRTESRQPRIEVLDNEGNVLAAYLLFDNATIYVKQGQRVRNGDLIARVITPANVLYNWRALSERSFKIWQGFGNSAFVSIFTTLLSVYFSAMTAYGLHVYRFKGRTAVWVIILVIMMLPGSLTFIGFYKLMVTMQLTNTYIPLIIPAIAAAATVLFIRQYMMSVLSFELIDAARIDGAGEYRIFNTIILPVTIPALAAQCIFTFVGSWNNYLMPTVIINDTARYTLPMLIQNLRGDIYRTEFGGIYLGIAISLIPIIIFYSFMSRFIISGLTMGGIKE